ncbi:oligoribonuclease [Candidatus Dojkabacteria bacterium]|nr:oligoribonuclease [Candidatus Dojkabacteria bacterium]
MANPVYPTIGPNLVWIDLEMTGPNPIKHAIIQIATLITDENLDVIAEGPEIIVHQSEEVLDNIWPDAKRIFNGTGFIDEVRKSRVSLKEAEKKTLDFVSKHCEYHTAPLCGNSVHVDRAFLKLYMPDLDEYFHYRNIDVTAFKEAKRMWYPEVEPFVKDKKHQALDDIKISIAELQYYREKILK